jgi:pimeloyl-ACP methyl ester carboxylesterase
MPPSGFSQEVRCGRAAATESRSACRCQSDIHYVVLPSQDKNKSPDAVFLLAGGPGQSAVQLAAAGNGMLGRLNKRRDLVFVDQRGTGKSAGLQCPELEKDDFSSDDDVMFQRMEQCRIRLQKLPHGQLTSTSPVLR